MKVGGRGDCIAMNIVGGKDSLPETPRGNKYIHLLLIVFRALLLLLLSLISLHHLLYLRYQVIKLPYTVPLVAFLQIRVRTLNLKNFQIFVYYFESSKFVQLHTILNRTISVKGLITLLNFYCVKHLVILKLPRGTYTFIFQFSHTTSRFIQAPAFAVLPDVRCRGSPTSEPHFRFLFAKF